MHTWTYARGMHCMPEQCADVCWKRKPTPGLDRDPPLLSHRLENVNEECTGKGGRAFRFIVKQSWIAES